MKNTNILIKLKSSKTLKLVYIILAIMFVVPSIIYIVKQGTVLEFDTYFNFFLNKENETNQIIIYIALLVLFTIIYFLIIKNRDKLFKNIKEVMIYIGIISAIFIIMLPFTSSDIFYYLGTGRLESEYKQNTYYTTIKEFVKKDENTKYLENDKVLEKGYNNYWSNTTVVYGPVWNIVCKTVSGISFGNIDFALILFKILNLLIHMLNAYLIYKISKKKIFVLIYGLNPFILLEGIASVHNDMFVVFFILLSLYFLLKKKNIAITVVFLALATAIKYFAILLLPIILIYYFRKEKPAKRFGKCVIYGILFILVLLIPYVIYMKDTNVFMGMAIQQEKISKSLYTIIKMNFMQDTQIIKNITKTLTGSFIIIYIFRCITLLFKPKIKIRKELQKYNYFLIVFIFILITNFQPWYILWLFPCIMWQKSSMIKLIIQISLISQFANIIFMIYGEGWKAGSIYFCMMLILAIGLYILNKQLKINKQIKAIIMRRKKFE